MINKQKTSLVLVVLSMMAAALLLVTDSIEIGTIAYFTDTEVATANVVMAGTWESISQVGAEGDGEWNSPNWQVAIYPGERKETTITFANSYVDDIAITLVVAAESDDDGNLIFGFDNETLVVPARGEASVLFWVEASQSVAPGTYLANISIER